MKYLPTHIILNILKYGGHNALYFHKIHMKEVNRLKKTFKENPIIFSFEKSIMSGGSIYKRRTRLQYKGGNIGNSYLNTENRMKQRIRRTIKKTNEIIEIYGKNFILETTMDRLNLYQKLWA